MKRSLVVAITGGSGAIYALRLLEVLLADGRDVHLSISPAGQEVIRTELGVALDLERFDPAALPLTAGEQAGHPLIAELLGVTRDSAALVPSPRVGRLHYYHYRDFRAPMASGSFLTDGMVVCPCSGGTVSAVAHATSTNLIQRAADVHLKERRRLVLVPRETPLSLIQLDNLRRCAEAGATILPAMPGFYHGARTVRDLVDFVVARLCDQLGVEHDLMRRWGSSEITE
ncbi:MAG: UbiX family flavin prenyltransferase [Pirellulales bacterium]|nr:UbiX family flavin prenyltransferase [Pirellulales bacterium]